MSPEDRDLGYIWDIYDSCKELMEFINKIDYENYTRNKMLRYAVERKLEIIGEASNRINKEFQQQYPNIFWQKMIGLRNILIHEYGEIRHEIIYSIVTNNIPVLFEQTKLILKEHNEPF